MKFKVLKNKLQKLDLTEYNNFKLDYITIINARAFVETHISYLEANTGNKTFMPYYNRILEFYHKTHNDDGKAINFSESTA